LAEYQSDSSQLLPEGPYSFEIRVETDVRHVYRGLQRLMSDYKNEKRGPTFIAVHSCQGLCSLLTDIFCCSSWLS